MQTTIYVGLDVQKLGISVSVAEEGRDGEVRFIGEIPNTQHDVQKLARRLAKDGKRLEFCYEAGGCGYVIYRQLITLGHACTVVAPSKIPRKPGDRIKTDRRDAQKLAILHRSGDLTAVWVPDEVHEAMRDLVRARIDAVMQLMRARQQLLSFLLRHGRLHTAGKHWTQRHRARQGLAALPLPSAGGYPWRMRQGRYSYRGLSPNRLYAHVGRTQPLAADRRKRYLRFCRRVPRLGGG